MDEAVSEPHEAPSGGVRQRLSAKAEAKAAAAASSSSLSGVNANHELPRGGVRKRLRAEIHDRDFRKEIANLPLLQSLKRDWA